MNCWLELIEVEKEWNKVKNSVIVEACLDNIELLTGFPSILRACVAPNTLLDIQILGGKAGFKSALPYFISLIYEYRVCSLANSSKYGAFYNNITDLSYCYSTHELIIEINGTDTLVVSTPASYIDICNDIDKYLNK